MRRTQQKQKWKECRQKENEIIMQFSLRVRALWEEVYPKETERRFGRTSLIQNAC